MDEPQRGKHEALIDRIVERTASAVGSNLDVKATMQRCVLPFIDPFAALVQFPCQGFEMTQFAAAGHERGPRRGLRLQRFPDDDVVEDVVAGGNPDARARARAALEQPLELEALQRVGGGQETRSHLSGDPAPGHRLAGLEDATGDLTAHILVHLRSESRLSVGVTHANASFLELRGKFAERNLFLNKNNTRGLTRQVPKHWDCRRAIAFRRTSLTMLARHRLRRSIEETVMRVLAAALVILGATAAPALAQPFANAKSSLANYTVADTAPQKTCDGLASFTAEGLVSVQARVVAATADTPQHCRVTGVISPEVAFEVNLPDRWNRRFYMTGNGGLAGDPVDTPTNGDRTAGLTNGFVHARTNTGHDARKESSGSFILSNPQKAIDYAYRAVHVTADTAKKIANEYYGRAITFSYWNSCSNGGRQGLLEAQRYPSDFDGIVAVAPWVDQTGFTVGAMWNQKALTDAPVTHGKLALVAQKVMEKCDALDGLKDGLIDDPRACRFDAARDVPACSAGADGDACLTNSQAAAINKVYSGPASNGKPFIAGFMPGSEAVTTAPNGTSNSGWVGAIVPAQPGAKPADFNLAEGVMRYLVLDPPQPNYDAMTFNYDRDTAHVARWSRQADAKQADLSAFRQSGGKLIITYGWADQILQPMMGVSYYEQVVASNPNAQEFARLFMMPGVAHCGGGVGPDRNDAVTAVIDWVEQGTAPDSLLASKVTDGKVVRTRPLCPYPQVARYKGQGSVDEAASFSCVAP